jgi:hypothetical protein
MRGKGECARRDPTANETIWATSACTRFNPAAQEVNCRDASLRVGSSPASELFGGDLPTAGSGMAMALGPLASAEAEAVW